MNIPYNTGKVSIGSKYKPPQHEPLMDRDALRLQRALLGERDTSLAAWAAYIATVISVIAGALIYS